MEQKLDLRVVKTRKNIQDTFIRLLQQKKFETITVQNILDEALINRTTFYKHYLDKFDLADGMIEDLLECVTNSIEKRFTTNKDGTYILLKNFYDSILQKKERMLSLFDVRTLKHHLSEDIRLYLKEKYRESKPSSNSQESEMEISYQSELYASVVLTSMKWVLELGEEDGIDIIIDRSVKQVGRMINTITEL